MKLFFSSVFLCFFLVDTISFRNLLHESFVLPQKQQCLHQYNNNNNNNNNNRVVNKTVSLFDQEFAESMSKPLPSMILPLPLQLPTPPPPQNSSLPLNTFTFPGFFEIFPELELKWPKWTMKHNKRIECESDADCKFPQACCHHPILPGKKYCCTGGYKVRALKPAFIPVNVYS